MLPKLLLILLLVVSAINIQAQTCTTIGQNPGTAFPVCGTNTFTQASVPVCGSGLVPVPCGNGAYFDDKNPFWYKFTCFVTGTLVFKIKPHKNSDDYDWQLFDITGHNPNDVYTDAGLFVCCNWSGKGGETGTNLSAGSFISCEGRSNPIFSKAPVLAANHEYLLLVSHFTNSQSGYDLSFGGGTAIITDLKTPGLQTAQPDCVGKVVTVILNKKIKCSSLASNGSDFTLSPASSNNILTATGIGCNAGFDTDSIVLTLQNPLGAGNYQVVAKNGIDGNTLLDYCNNGIPVGNLIPFTIAPNQPTPFDSISPVGCQPNKVKVIFRKPILCSSISNDLSEFSISGTQPVAISGISTACNAAGQTSSIILNLNRQLQTAGNYQLVLKQGSDGNTLIDICGQQTLPNSTISFSVKDTVSADFSYTAFLDCKVDSIAYISSNANGINTWNWLFDSTRKSTLQNPMIRYSAFGKKRTTLIVSNGMCSDTAFKIIYLDNFLNAQIAGPNVLCPKDSARFNNYSLGKIKSWKWNFGNGNSSIQQQAPSQLYQTSTTDITYFISLVVEDSLNCKDSTAQRLLVVNNCYIDVPTAFTPNGDGLNDYLAPLNAYKAINLQFKVFNRFGQLVWQTTDWTRKWDGRINGELPATGAYVWFLSYTNKETGKKIQLQGTSILIR